MHAVIQKILDEIKLLGPGALPGITAMIQASKLSAFEKMILMGLAQHLASEPVAA